ncbi:hypothetical protein H6P81_009843 [Aristolochia fimbriata]|uniref:Uncharacterized protein n=1 Tax=Aristolochia fimbriata TaxID=158543 RepID=A0AAV7EM67_ARIFI|nr:hypothetical protein H6P81_009843 [Aristolochia fimbriata]
MEQRKSTLKLRTGKPTARYLNSECKTEMCETGTRGSREHKPAIEEVKSYDLHAWMKSRCRDRVTEWVVGMARTKRGDLRWTRIRAWLSAAWAPVSAAIGVAYTGQTRRCVCWPNKALHMLAKQGVAYAGQTRCCLGWPNKALASGSGSGQPQPQGKRGGKARARDARGR